MDGDRPMADGRDVFESIVQDLIHRAFLYGYYKGLERDYEPAKHLPEIDEEFHKLFVSYLDGEPGDVGAQDEASEARAVGDGVRPETYINFEFEGERIPIGTCDLNETDDGEIHMRIKFF